MDNNQIVIPRAPSLFYYVLDREARFPTPTVAQIQAGFANPTGWDGWIRLMKFPKTSAPILPTGLFFLAERVAKKFGWRMEIRDLRKKPEDFDVPDPCTVTLRDYQQTAVEEALRVGRGVIDCPPRSGKTLLLSEVIRRLALPTVWIAPTDRIIDQTRGVLQKLFGKGRAVHQIGSKGWEEAAKYRIVVLTTATATVLPPEFYKTRQVLIIDEFHRAASKSVHDIVKMCGHIYYRFGATGTFFRSGDDGLAMQAVLSNTIFKITSRELMARKFLVPVKVVFLPVLGRIVGAGRGFIGGHGKEGIHEHEYRNSLVAHVVQYLQGVGRRVLVLVGTKVQGRELTQLIRDLVPPNAGKRFRSVEMVTSGTPRDIQSDILASFIGRGDVQVLVGTSLIGEGVDLPTCDALVYAHGGKAEVALVQNAFRVATMCEGKIDAVIVDFADRHHKKLMEHALERIRIYHEEPSFDVSVLQDANEFPTWLAGITAK